MTTEQHAMEIELIKARTMGIVAHWQRQAMDNERERMRANEQLREVCTILERAMQWVPHEHPVQLALMAAHQLHGLRSEAALSDHRKRMLLESQAELLGAQRKRDDINTAIVAMFSAELIRLDVARRDPLNKGNERFWEGAQYAVTDFYKRMRETLGIELAIDHTHLEEKQS